MDKKPAPPKKTSRLQVRVALVAALCIAVGLAYKQWFGPPTPEQVRDRAIHALETGDTEALCRLADPEELQKLQLTPQQVSAALRETVWALGRPRLKTCKLFTAQPADRRVWLVDWQGTPHKHYLGITVIDDLHVGWRIILSDLLHNAYYQDRDFGAASDAYTGKFIGLRSDGGEYRFFNTPQK